jgi:hypothetical protein
MDLGVGRRQDRVLCGAPSPSRLYEESCHVAQRESDVSERSVHSGCVRCAPGTYASTSVGFVMRKVNPISQPFSSQ